MRVRVRARASRLTSPNWARFPQSERVRDDPPVRNLAATASRAQDPAPQGGIPRMARHSCARVRRGPCRISPYAAKPHASRAERGWAQHAYWLRNRRASLASCLPIRTPPHPPTYTRACKHAPTPGDQPAPARGDRIQEQKGTRGGGTSTDEAMGPLAPSRRRSPSSHTWFWLAIRIRAPVDNRGADMYVGGYRGAFHGPFILPEEDPSAPVVLVRIPYSCAPCAHMHAVDSQNDRSSTVLVDTGPIEE
ncbi:hypothetical protein BU17DRAFT_88952 [Hysterangium stoloniferum]|nr:hypothetical protein BU17DRAFT_88952 [Hysterangium stoloniferum]